MVYLFCSLILCCLSFACLLPRVRLVISSSCYTKVIKNVKIPSFHLLTTQISKPIAPLMKSTGSIYLYPYLSLVIKHIVSQPSFTTYELELGKLFVANVLFSGLSLLFSL